MVHDCRNMKDNALTSLPPGIFDALASMDTLCVALFPRAPGACFVCCLGVLPAMARGPCHVLATHDVAYMYCRLLKLTTP